jgi:hypothetical protein
MSFHLQSAVNNWTEKINLLPPNSTFKAFQPQLLDEAKRINPGLLTVMRYWDDPNQVFNAGSFSGYAEAARRFFNRFIDGTFMTLAHNVDFVEGWNEYLANGQSAAEVNERVLWVDAATAVWNNEFRTIPELEHIRFVGCNAAIGNDIPEAMARILYARDAVIGYHPYMPVRNGKPFTFRTSTAFLSGPEEAIPTQKVKMVPGSLYPVLLPDYQIESANSLGDDGRRFFWLRWQAMDEMYRAKGVYPEWLFTEFNPLNYVEHSWGLHLDGGGGWRHKDVCNGNIPCYINSVLLFCDEVARWNAQNQGRAIGTPMNFTTGAGNNSVWSLFETGQPEIGMISDALRVFKPSRGANSNPPVTPPPPTGDLTPLEQEIYDLGKDITDANNDSALQLAIWKDGWDLGGPEKWFTSKADNKQYAVKPAVSKDDKTVVRVYYCEVPKWNEVKWVEPKK